MLQIHDLSVSFSSYGRGLRRTTLRAVRSLDLTAEAGELVAVVGQSGAGKSLLAQAVLGILPGNATVSGTLLFKGTRLTPQKAALLRGREIALIPQSVAYLNPLLHVGTQIARAGELSGLSPKEARDAARQALRRYGLPGHVWTWFPFQLSGGMARRVLTATATIGAADLLLADEPTNGLDRNTARETLLHLRQLADAGKAVVLITHAVESALLVADKVFIVCGGVTVEQARPEDFNGSGALRHPYSRMLWLSLPGKRFTEALPSSGKNSLTPGCPFTARCDQGDEECDRTLPELKPLGRGLVRCRHA